MKASKVFKEKQLFSVEIIGFYCSQWHAMATSHVIVQTAVTDLGHDETFRAMNELILSFKTPKHDTGVWGLSNQENFVSRRENTARNCEWNISCAERPEQNSYVQEMESK